MNPVNKKAPNCINNPAECIQWNSGNIDYLGVCNGDYLPEIIWEIVNKLQAIAEEDLSTFDINGLLEICNAKAPLEVNLLSILTLLRDNEICLKDYIDVLSQKIIDLQGTNNIVIDLSCLDNTQYNLGVTQQELNQIVVNELCTQRNKDIALGTSIIALEGRVQELEDAPPPTVNEPTFSTCVDGAVKSTSNQVKSIATTFCEYRDKVGTLDEIGEALSQTPEVWTDDSFVNKLMTQGKMPEWITNAKSWADNYNNLLIAYTMLQEDVANILATCCAPTCDKVKIGFSIIPGDEPNDFIVRYRPTDGTSIPTGFKDSGSTITFTDVNGIVYGPFTTDVTDQDGDSNVYNLNGLTLTKPIFVTVNAKVASSTLYCEKCVGKSVNLNDASCPVCAVTAVNGDLTIVYQVN